MPNQTRPCNANLLSPFATSTPWILDEAFALADDACRTDIEVLCACACEQGRDWYDTGNQTDDSEDAFIRRAVRYLEQRGEAVDGWHMVRHSTHAGWVGFQPAPPV